MRVYQFTVVPFQALRRPGHPPTPTTGGSPLLGRGACPVRQWWGEVISWQKLVVSPLAFVISVGVCYWCMGDGRKTRLGQTLQRCW